jgi:hypothetical protein
MKRKGEHFKMYTLEFMPFNVTSKYTRTFLVGPYMIEITHHKMYHVWHVPLTRANIDPNML